MIVSFAELVVWSIFCFFLGWGAKVFQLIKAGEM